MSFKVTFGLHDTTKHFYSFIGNNSYKISTLYIKISTSNFLFIFANYMRANFSNEGFPLVSQTQSNIS